MEGDAAPVATHYTDHDGAAIEVADFGVNRTRPQSSADGPGPDSPGPGDYRPAPLVDKPARQLVALADITVRGSDLGELVEPMPALPPTMASRTAWPTPSISRRAASRSRASWRSPRWCSIAPSPAAIRGTICQVVTQPWQFSFVRRGHIPAADRNSESWRRAVAIARIAEAGASRLLPRNVLWYHADYVSPSWGRRLARNTKIGLHIFYS